MLLFRNPHYSVIVEANRLSVPFYKTKDARLGQISLSQ